MEEKARELSERLLCYGAIIVGLCDKLDASMSARHIAKQLLRSGTSAGANYAEACGAQSKADFIHKLQIVLKELRESLYWLNLLQRAEISTTKELEISIDETRQIGNIIAKSVITAKKNRAQL
ncbi:MAG: hypothetical protein A2Z34_02530 [Planctomycetes bacterium RBG_16_59_8]|nr:MAG: hypothetical protein A2Z34_02530 [Planctomycetes bacterium RBG_16_59_8]